MPELDPREKRAQSLVGLVLKEKWRLDDVIGIGGMATVFGATHRNNGKRVAVKLLHPELSRITQIRTRFLREGYASNQVDHPGAVAVLDDDVSETGAVFLVMELLDGETLEQRRLSRGGRLEPLEVLWVADQLLDVIAAAHARGIIHRDIKPDNLLLTRQGALKVLDFGLARVRPAAGDQMPGLTRTNMVMGTIEFMSPEQARGAWDTVDNRSDIWAIGATLFTLLTGAPVHTSPDPAEHLRSASSKPARSVSHLLPKLHAGVVRVVDRALAYRPDKRWPDARTMQLAAREVYTALKTGIDLSAASMVADMADEPSTGLQVPRPGGRPSAGAAREPPAAGERAEKSALAHAGLNGARDPGPAPLGAAPGGAAGASTEPEIAAMAEPPGASRGSSHNLVGTIDSGVTTRWQVTDPLRPMLTSLETPTGTHAASDSVVASSAPTVRPPPMRESSTPAFSRPFPPPPPPPPAAAAVFAPPPVPQAGAALPAGAVPPPPLPASSGAQPAVLSSPSIRPGGRRAALRRSAAAGAVVMLGVLGLLVLVRISRTSRAAEATPASSSSASGPAASAEPGAASADPLPSAAPPAGEPPAAASGSADAGGKKRPPGRRVPRGPVKIRGPSK